MRDPKTNTTNKMIYHNQVWWNTYKLTLNQRKV